MEHQFKGNSDKDPIPPDIRALLNEAMHPSFYGSLQIEFQGGKSVLIRQVQTYKPLTEDQRYNRRGSDVHPADIHTAPPSA